MHSRFTYLLEVLARRLVWVLGGACALLLWFFAELSEEVLEENQEPGGLLAADRAVLRAMLRLRRPWLNPIAVDLTALGSPTVLGLLTTFAILLMLFAGHRARAQTLLASSIGAALLTLLLKRVLGRARPSEIPRLVEVASQSYPSGHSLASAAILTTAGILLCQYLLLTSQRFVVVVTMLLLILAIGASRVYLGVHYPSDVVAGISFGVAWAFAIAAVTRALQTRASRMRHGADQRVP